MIRMVKLIASGAAFAALAAAAPATAQYYPNYGYSNSYGYNNGYSNRYNRSYGYNNGYAMNTSAAASQCTAAVNNRLYTRQGLGGVIGALLGAYATSPRVVSVTRVSPNGYGGARVRGLASSGRSYGYNQADLSFRCDVDANGYIRDVSVNRR